MTPKEAMERFKLKLKDLSHDRATDLICLRCGGRVFRVGVVGYVTLYPTGDIGDYEHLEFADDEECMCVNCGHEATVADFIVEGLDALIAKTYNAG